MLVDSAVLALILLEHCTIISTVLVLILLEHWYYHIQSFLWNPSKYVADTHKALLVNKSKYMVIKALLVYRSKYVLKPRNALLVFRSKHIKIYVLNPIKAPWVFRSKRIKVLYVLKPIRALLVFRSKHIEIYVQKPMKALLAFRSKQINKTYQNMWKKHIKAQHIKALCSFSFKTHQNAKMALEITWREDSILVCISIHDMCYIVAGASPGPVVWHITCRYRH